MLCIKQVEEFFERDIFSEKIYFDLLNTHFFVDCFVALASIASRNDTNKLEGFAKRLKNYILARTLTYLKNSRCFPSSCPCNLFHN
jgi:hypothetical protein